MAYSILQQPASGSLNASNNIIIANVVQQDGLDNTYKDYKFIADLKVNTVVSVRLKSFPEPGTDKGVFTLDNIANAFTSHDFEELTDTGVFAECLKSSCAMQLVFGEEYVLNGDWTQALELATGNSFIVLNAAPKSTDPAMSNFLPANTTKKFLTLVKKIVTRSGVFGNAYLYFYSPGGNICNKVKITTYNAAGAVLGVYTANNAFTANAGVQRVNVGNTALQTLQSNPANYTVVSGAANIYTTNVASLKVTLINNSNTEVIETITVINDDSCNQFENNMQLFWLNRFGGFDNFLFLKQNILSEKKTTQSFNKQRGKLSGNSYVQHSYDRGKVDYFTDIKQTYTLNQDYLSKEDVLLLAGLVNSPIVFYRDEAGNLYSAAIEESEYKLTKTEKNYKLSLKMSPSFTYNAQLQ